MKLYTYFRSSAAYRVRIALNLKGVEHELLPVNLLQREHKSPGYTERNPQGLVPALETGEGDVLAQSVAIMEWLEESCPGVPLLPREPLARARVRGVVGHITCDIHPILNISVLNYLKGPLQATPEQVQDWYCAWIHRGFAATEATLRETAGEFCFGDAPTLADCCLVPQVFNAMRFQVPMDDYPTIARIDAHCNTLGPFAAAHPSRQPDAPA